VAGRDDTAPIGADDDLGVDASPVVLGWALGFDCFQAARLVDAFLASNRHGNSCAYTELFQSFSRISASAGYYIKAAGIDIDLDGPRSGN
jgi:hypothetical protein